MNCAIIPVRDFANTKLRLRSLLNDQERASLTSTLLRGVLVAIEHSPIERVVVVATNPAEVEGLSRITSKLRVLNETQRRGGVNGAMEDGLRFILNQDPKENHLLFLMPSDLPFLNREAIVEALELKKDHDLIVNGSRRKDGTSLLMMESSKTIPLHYDDNSFVNHQREAARLGFDYLASDLEQFSCDLDDESDISLVMQRLGARSFQDLLDRLRSMRRD